MSTRPKTPRKWKTYDDEKKERIVMQIDNDLQSDKVTIKDAYKRVKNKSNPVRSLAAEVYYLLRVLPQSW